MPKYKSENCIPESSVTYFWILCTVGYLKKKRKRKVVTQVDRFPVEKIGVSCWVIQGSLCFILETKSKHLREMFWFHFWTVCAKLTFCFLWKKARVFQSCHPIFIMAFILWNKNLSLKKEKIMTESFDLLARPADVCAGPVLWAVGTLWVS